jgi:hypothetical protein
MVFAYSGAFFLNSFDNVIEIDRDRQVLFDYSAYMNTLEIDHVLKTHPSTRNVFK